MAHFAKFQDLLREGKVEAIPLTEDYAFKHFDCGNDLLNDFLFSESKAHFRHLRFATTLLEANDKVIAYYSLANDLLTIRDIEDFIEEIESDKTPNIESGYWEYFINQARYPAIKLGRLAVDVDFQSQGVGNFIIQSLVQSFITNNNTGCQFITVDAINDHCQQRAMNFYERHGFKYLTLADMGNDSRVMYKSLISCL
ncbi:Acetyltransferase (GNAT) family protein [Bacteroidales bacterium Barb4]|nr:Acetyltransferase (GNAT) family protein [Bacteroidales bacterium Barb4]